MSGNRIVVVGSSNTDMIIKVSRIPLPGETVSGGNFSMAAGGKGANQAVSAARAGGRVSFIARVGADLFGETAIEGFVTDGIDVSCVLRDKEAPTGTALIFVGEDGENSIAVAPGANSRLSKADIESFRGVIASADILVMQLETPLASVQAAVEIAAASGVRVVLNPAPAAVVPAEVLRQVDFLTPNEHEAKVLTGVEVRDEVGAEKAADLLLALGTKTVLITLGAQGAYVASGSMRGMVRGYAVDAVDSTAAGDVFNGALAVALCESKPLREAVTFANAAAALSVTKLGAQPSIPRRQEIEAFLSAHSSDT
jgi:ribokinase